jgi:hypothetical protein
MNDHGHEKASGPYPRNQERLPARACKAIGHLVRAVDPSRVSARAGSTGASPWGAQVRRANFAWARRDEPIVVQAALTMESASRAEFLVASRCTRGSAGSDRVRADVRLGGASAPAPARANERLRVPPRRVVRVAANARCCGARGTVAAVGARLVRTPGLAGGGSGDGDDELAALRVRSLPRTTH